MIGLEKTILMEKRRYSFKIGNRVINDLTFDDILDINLYVIRYKLKHGEIS